MNTDLQRFFKNNWAKVTRRPKQMLGVKLSVFFRKTWNGVLRHPNTRVENILNR